MYVILTYDVNVKRVAKVMKTCRKYLTHEQRSVFEGSITDRSLDRLKGELKKLVDVKEDSVSIYEFQSLKYTSRERLGLIAEEGTVL